MAIFITPNTRQQGWEQMLLDQIWGAKRLILVEPDKPVLDFLNQEGVEFTLIDPQHFGGGDFSSAIKMAESIVRSEGPSPEAVFIGGFKHDLDMLGAMSLLSQTGGVWDSNRIEAVDAVDTGTHFGVWDPQSVDDNILLLQNMEIEDTKVLGKMASARRLSLEAKVATMATWLQGGEAPQQFKEELLEERKLLMEAKTEVLSGIKVVTCESAGVSSLIYRTTSVAGEGFPYGIAFNPNFRGQGPKMSVLQYSNEYVDTVAFFARMNELEEAEGTWGGNPKLGIGGSPLGTTITPEQAAQELVKFLTPKGEEYLMS